MWSDNEIVPKGEDARNPRPGDFILCHRKGFASAAIRLGERIKYRSGAHWSHAAFVETPDTLIEALTKGVVRTPLSFYRDIEYTLVRTYLSEEDESQVVAFARSCLGKRYGFLADLGIGLRFMTPGRGLWFGMDGSEICSGLVAQAQCRSWMIFPHNPTSISPAELAKAYGISVDAKSA